MGHTDWGADRIVLPHLYRALQTGLMLRCIWIGSSIGFKAVGSDPPSGLAYRVGGFPHISCPKSPRESTRTVPGFSPSKTCIKVCSGTKISTGKIQPTVVFLNPLNDNYLNEDSPSKIPPIIISVYMLPHLEKSKLNLKLTDDACFLDIIFRWTLSAPAVRFDVNKYKKDMTI